MLSVVDGDAVTGQYLGLQPIGGDAFEKRMHVRAVRAEDPVGRFDVLEDSDKLSLIVLAQVDGCPNLALLEESGNLGLKSDKVVFSHRFDWCFVLKYQPSNSYTTLRNQITH